MVNYSNGKIYKIVDHVNNKCYIGSTCKLLLSQRLAGHKAAYKLALKTGVKKMTSHDIIANGNYTILLLESFPCTTKNELLARERYYVETIDCVNKVIPSRTDKEYYQDNKEKFKEYYQDNKEKIANKNKLYYERHKDEVKAKNSTTEHLKHRAEWYENNKEHLNERMKEYYVENKEKIQIRHQQYNIANKEKIQEYQREWAKANRAKRTEQQRLLRAKQKIEKLQIAINKHDETKLEMKKTLQELESKKLELEDLKAQI